MILGRYTPEEYAAFWGCDPCYDTPPRLPGDGYLFYNFGSERQFRDQDYLTRLLGAIDRTIPITMTSPPHRGRVSDDGACDNSGAMYPHFYNGREERMSTGEFKIARVILPGEFEQPQDSNDLLEQAGRVLDHACLGDGVGDHLFQGKDGKLYIVTFEACVNEARPGYAKELMQRRMGDLEPESMEYKTLRDLLMEQVRDAAAFLKDKRFEQDSALSVHEIGGDFAEAIEIILPDWDTHEYDGWTIGDVIAYPDIHPEMYEAQL